MKPYDRLNEFLRNSNGIGSKTRNHLLFGPLNLKDAEDRDRIEEIKNKRRNIKSTFQKNMEIIQNNSCEEEIDDNKKKEILEYYKNQFSIFSYDKYFIIGKYSPEIKKDQEIINKTLKHIEDIIMYSYLGIFDMIEINDEDFSYISKNYFKDVIVKEEHQPDIFEKTMKIIDEMADMNTINSNKFHFIVKNKGNKCIVTGIYEKAKRSGQFILSFVNNTAGIIETAVIVIEDSEIYVGIDSIYARKEHIAKKFIENIIGIGKELGLQNIEQRTALFMIRMIYIFRHICEHITKEKMNYEVIESSPLELNLIHRILANKSVFADNSELVIKIPILIGNKFASDLNNLPSDELKKIMDNYEPEFVEKYMNAESLEKIIDQIVKNKDSYTEIELDGDECHKIVKYIDRTYIRGKRKCNFGEMIENQRYGKDIKMNLFEDSSEFIYVHPEYNKETHNLFINFYFENRKYKFMFTCEFANAHEFQFGDNTQIKHLEMFISIGPDANLIKSRQDLINLLPNGMGKASRILVILTLFLSIYGMISDRPEKLCTCRKEILVSKGVPTRKNPKPENKYIIKHIVAYRQGVVQRIKEAKESGIERQVEYVVENWDRIGHLRNYKNGKSVWISPVKCHRHKELTVKPIKVKY